MSHPRCFALIACTAAAADGAAAETKHLQRSACGEVRCQKFCALVTYAVATEIQLLKGPESGEMGRQRFCALVTYAVVTESQLLKQSEGGEVGRQRFCSLVTYAVPVKIQHVEGRKRGEVGGQRFHSLVTYAVATESKLLKRSEGGEVGRHLCNIEAPNRGNKLLELGVEVRLRYIVWRECEPAGLEPPQRLRRLHSSAVWRSFLSAVVCFLTSRVDVKAAHRQHSTKMGKKKRAHKITFDWSGIPSTAGLGTFSTSVRACAATAGASSAGAPPVATIAIAASCPEGCTAWDLNAESATSLLARRGGSEGASR